MSEKCPSDEKHCTCVPDLRKQIKSLESRVKELEEALKKLLDHLFLNGVEQQDEYYLQQAKQALEGNKNDKNPKT